MQCPVCQKQIRLQRFVDGDNLSYPFPYRAWRNGKWSSQLTIQCDETILLDNGRGHVRHFYKDYWGGGDNCGIWIVIYPYRVRQLKTMTQIQRYRNRDERLKLIADGHGNPDVSDWELIVEVPKLTNEEAIRKCEEFKKHNVKLLPPPPLPSINIQQRLTSLLEYFEPRGGRIE